MDFRINGKRALVLASSGGLGAGIAQSLAAEGADVLVTGRNEERLAQVVAAINSNNGGKASYIVLDMAVPDAAGKLIDAAATELGGVDILVNNTGGPPAGTTGGDWDVWRAQFEVMVMRLMEMTDLVLPGMREEKWGRIITVGSSGVQQPIPNLAMSNTLRSALVGWTKSLAGEVGSDNITVNMLIPGRIHTDRVDQLDAAAAKRQGKLVEEVAEASRATIPLGRYGKVEEFAAVAAFLASEPAGYLTGSVVRCDGGLIRSV
ncbi:MAG: SDR family oxidoreductase [Hyphomicrobiales bacterium]|nr:SDR family oxidoreductase [Hyphomicrobiales bacterium]MCP4997253.1 SDR family oxidoreductase [Hyphomicrobiales bacterium]